MKFKLSRIAVALALCATWSLLAALGKAVGAADPNSLSVAAYVGVALLFAAASAAAQWWYVRRSRRS